MFFHLFFFKIYFFTPIIPFLCFHSGTNTRADQRKELESRLEKSKFIMQDCEREFAAFLKNRDDTGGRLRSHMVQQRSRLIEWGSRQKFTTLEDSDEKFKEKVNDVMAEWEEGCHQFRNIRTSSLQFLSSKMKEIFNSNYACLPSVSGTEDPSLMDQARAWYKSGRNFVIKVVKIRSKEEPLGNGQMWSKMLDQFLGEHVGMAICKFAENHCPLEDMMNDFLLAFKEKSEALKQSIAADYSPEEEKLAVEVYPTISVSLNNIVRETDPAADA